MRPLNGFEVFNKGELIATGDALEVHAPCDGCPVCTAARAAIIGRKTMYLTTSLD